MFKADSKRNGAKTIFDLMNGNKNNWQQKLVQKHTYPVYEVSGVLFGVNRIYSIPIILSYLKINICSSLQPKYGYSELFLIIYLDKIL